MKKKYLFMVGLLLFSASLMYAQNDHMKLFMPKWKASSCAEVESGSNYSIPGNRIFNGNRVGNLDQKVVNIDNPFKFPSMVPLIIWAKTPKGTKEVIWNIDSEKVQVVGYATGSVFISNNHITTPVNNSTTTVTVENPYRTKRTSKIDKLKYNWESYKHNKFVKESFYELNTGGEESLHNKEFMVPAGYAYLIVIATQNEYVHISATSKENAADLESTAVSHIKFYDENLLVKCADNEDFTAYISGSPNLENANPPISILYDKNNTVKYDITVENRSNNKPLSANRVLIKFEPVGDNWTTPTIKKLSDYIGNGVTIARGDKKVFQINANIDFNKISSKVGETKILKAKVSMLYPTIIPGSAKSVELDIPSRKGPTPPPPPPPPVEKKQLAVIGTEYTLNGGTLMIQNKTNDANRILTLVSVNLDGRSISINEDIKSTNAYRLDVEGVKYIKVYYKLYENDNSISGSKQLVLNLVR